MAPKDRATSTTFFGTWHGKLSIPTDSLTIVFHISQTGQGTYVTTLDSPDLGANSIKTQTTSFNDSILAIQIPIIHASYKGKLDSNQTISGTFTQGMPIPLNLEKGEASRPKRPQKPQPPFPYKSEEVIVRNEQDGINLAGTLTLPQKGTKFPAVVMVTGSGAQNRDEEIMGYKPFLVITDYLTRNEIAVLRCDDRGTAASQSNHTTATNEELQKELYADVTQTMSPEQLKDLNTIQQNKNVTIKAYPNLNHLFQTCEKGTLAEYGQLEETISPEVLKDIMEWIKKQ